MIEAALTVPILLGILFIFVWGAYLWNARISFFAAVDNAPRLALTRSNQDRTGTPGGTIGDLSTFALGAPDSVPVGFEKALFNDPNGGLPPALMLQAELFYDANTVPGLSLPASPGRFRAGFPGPGGSPVASIYHYALAFVHMAMAESVGQGLLKYPCNPYQDSDSNNIPDPETDGCLACIFLDSTGNSSVNRSAPAGGFQLSALPFPPASTYTYTAQCMDPGSCPIISPYPPDRLILECHYRPAGFITGTIYGLLRMAGAANFGVWVERASVL